MSAAGDRAELLLTMGRHRDAERAAREAIADEPEAAAGYVQLARALAGLGRHEEAAAACKVGVGKAPGWGWPVAVLAWVRNEQKRHREAIDLLHAALRLSPWDPFTHGQMAYALRESGRPRQARTAAREGLKVAPFDDFLLAQLGWSEKALGRLRAADEAAARGLAHHPTSTHLLGLRGCVLWQRAERWGWLGTRTYRRAYGVLLEAVRQDPGAGWTGRNLDNCLKNWRKALIGRRALAAGVGLWLVGLLGTLAVWGVVPAGSVVFPVFLVVFFLAPFHLLGDVPGFLHLPRLPAPAAPLSRRQRQLGRALWGLMAVWALVVGAAVVAVALRPPDAPAGRR